MNRQHQPATPLASQGYAPRSPHRAEEEADLFKTPPTRGRARARRQLPEDPGLHDFGDRDIETSANTSSSTPKNRTSRTKMPANRRGATPSTPETLANRTTYVGNQRPPPPTQQLQSKRAQQLPPARPTQNERIHQPPPQPAQTERSQQPPRTEPTPPRRSGRQRFAPQRYTPPLRK